METISKMSSAVLVLLIILHPKSTESSSATLADKLFMYCLDGYNKNTLPLLNNTKTVDIDVNVGLVSINDFDEISGELHLTAVFFMTWNEERITWSPEDYGGKTTLNFPADDIWHPKIFVVQSFDRMQYIGGTPFDIRLSNAGKATWSTGMVLRVSCFVDVTYFPFDTQKCELQFTGWMYAGNEVSLTFNTDTLYMKYFTNNSQWIVSQSKLTTFQINSNDFADYEMPASLVVQIWLKRRHEFYLVYIIIPVIFLAIINNLVFLLPTSSGERMSVAVTVFLSLVVYMGVINSSVPESSAPVAYIYTYLLFLLVYSSCIIFLCIASLCIHDMIGDVPRAIQVVVLFMRMTRCFRNKSGPVEQPVNRKTNVESIRVDDNENKHVATIANNTTSSTGEEDNSELHVQSDTVVADVTWTIVGHTFDIYCLVSMYLALVIFSFDTFSNLYRNTNF